MHINPNQPVILLASSRSAGNTFDLARRVLPEGSAPLIDLSQLNIGYFSYLYANANDDFLPLVEQLLLSPVLGFSRHHSTGTTMSAQAKTFIDRLSDLLSSASHSDTNFAAKVWLLVCTGTDSALPSAFNQPLELTCSYLGMSFLARIMPNMPTITLSVPVQVICT